MAIRSRLLRIAILLGSSVYPMASHSAPCVGFTDVDDASAFCKNVEWLKNRAITLGCTSSTLYCPNDIVTRLSMAAFLNRPANALTPIEIRVTTSGGAVDLETVPAIYTTTPITVTDAPRLAHADATLLAFGGASPADVIVSIDESHDGGTTFNPASQYQAGTTSGSGNRESISVMMPPRNVLVGTSYTWALRLNRQGSSTTGDVGAWQCHLRVTLENRNPASPPLDDEE